MSVVGRNSMATDLEELLAPIRKSPRLVEAVGELQRQIDAERIRRERFYEDMTPEQKIEFIDGEVVLHSPARNIHLDVTKYVSYLLDAYVRLKQLGTVKVEKCLCVFPRNDYEPDVVFFGPEKAATFTAETLKFPVPDLIVEVLSHSTMDRDRGVKFEDYAANGVTEYWIIDAEAATLEQYLLEDGQYRLAIKSGSGRLTSVAIDGLDLDVESLFDEAKNLSALQSLLGDR